MCIEVCILNSNVREGDEGELCGSSRRVKFEKQTSASKKKFEANKSLGPIVDSTSRLKFYTISDKSLYVKLKIQIK